MGSSINGVLARVGVRISRVDRLIADLREATRDPVEAAYRAGSRPFLIEARLADCRVLPPSAFGCAAGINNPLVESLIAYMQSGAAEYVGSPLERFHLGFQPRSAAEALGLPSVDPSSELVTSSPFGFVYPWSGQTPRLAEAHWRETIAADNREHGLANAAQGWKSWGPVDRAVGDMEFRRLITLYEAIRGKGYRRSDLDDGDIRGTVLLRGEEARILVASGQHRAAALAALGTPEATIRIAGPLVRRDDVARWPNVISKRFDLSGALLVFDRVFDGRQPGGSTSSAA